MFAVSIDGSASVSIEADSHASAAERAALDDGPGWNDGHYRSDQSVAVVTDECGVTQAFVLEGGDATFAAWYLPG